MGKEKYMMKYTLKFLRVFSITVLFSALTLLAAPVPEYTAPYSGTAPRMDGRVLEDPVWKNIPWSRPFIIQDSGKKNKKQPPLKKPGKTLFKALYTSDSVYFAIQCSEPAMDKVLEESGVTEFWKYDIIEFFSLVKKNELLHLLVSIHNKTMDEIPNAISERTKSYNTWQGSSYRGKDAWFSEVRVPLYLLGIAPKNTKDRVSFRFNLCRFDTPTKNFTTWADVTTYRSATQYGIFFFAPPPANALAQLKKALLLPPDIALIQRWNVFRNDPAWDAASKAEKKVCDEMISILKKDPLLRQNAELFGKKMQYLDSRRAAIEMKHKEALKKRFFEE